MSDLQLPTHNPMRALIAAQTKAQAGRLVAASICAALVSMAAVILLGLSAWFLTASAIAGLAGPLVAKAFNYMIPSAMIRLLAIVRTAARYGERVTGHDAALNALAAIRPALFSEITKARPQKSLSLSRGEASARLMQDVDAVQNRFVRLSAPWGAGAGIGAGIALCAFTGWTVALAVATVSGLFIAASVLLARKVTQQAGPTLRTTAGAFKDKIGSLSAAAPELRAYGMTQWACDQLVEAAQPYMAARRILTVGMSWLMTLQTLAMALAVGAVVLTGAHSTPPLLALALLGAIATLDACGTLVTAIGQNSEVAHATERLDALLEPAPAVADGAPILPHIDIQGLFALRTRSRLGIHGASGTGKTTLVEQLMKLRPSPAGSIRIGGHDLADLSPKQARAIFAYAPQQPHFINGTVAENLRLAAPKATDDELWEALDQACLADRIRNSPHGLKMPVGENGQVLSGGERRRLGLARAYLRNAPFLVMDEPTEGLDAATERMVIDRLRKRLALSGQGLILISHRPAPLTICHDHASVEGIDADGAVKVRALEGPCLQTERSQSVAV